MKLERVCVFIFILACCAEGVGAQDNFMENGLPGRPYIIGAIDPNNRNEPPPRITAARIALLYKIGDKSPEEQVKLAKAVLTAHGDKGIVFDQSDKDTEIAMLIRIKCFALDIKGLSFPEEIAPLKKLLPFFEELSKDSVLSHRTPDMWEWSNARLVKMSKDGMVYRENPFVELVEILKKQ